MADRDKELEFELAEGVPSAKFPLPGSDRGERISLEPGESFSLPAEQAATALGLHTRLVGENGKAGAVVPLLRVKSGKSLKKIAADLEIEGRSKMSDEELAAAVAAASSSEPEPEPSEPEPEPEKEAE